MGLLNRLSGFCESIHNKAEIPYAKLHWSDSLHWCQVGNVLVFSGSNSARDWMHNFKLWPRFSPTGPGTVHAGFLDLARLTWPQLKETVLGKERIEFVTGYSLGAAVALLVAEKMVGVEVITYACPVVGTADWTNRYPHKVTRCWVNPDLVTTKILGRLHIGREIVCPGGFNMIDNHRYTLDRNWDWV